MLNIPPLHPIESRILQAGRGGDVLCSWYKCAHFDSQTASIVDSEANVDGRVKNVLNDADYRTISCMHGIAVNNGNSAHLYFASAYDGEEKGHELNVGGDQTSRANKKAFKSVVARTELPSGKTTILARYSGLKVEALSIVETDGKATGIELFSDDEALGSLVGVFPLVNEGLTGNATEFVDLAAATANATGIEKKRFGCSGCSNHCNVTKDFVEHRIK